MPTTATAASFALAATALVLLPGPAMLFLVSRGIGQGRRLAFASTLGIEAATATMVLLTAFGLSALISSSVVAFSIVKYAGAAYLVYLAVKEFRSHGRFSVQAKSVRGPGRAFLDAYVVGISNPKTAVFFLAFFPQFVHPASGPVWSQVLVLGGIFVAIGLVLDSCYALSAGSVGQWLQRHPTALHRQKFVSGSIFLALGGVAALSGGPQNS